MIVSYDVADSWESVSELVCGADVRLPVVTTLIHFPIFYADNILARVLQEGLLQRYT